MGNELIALGGAFLAAGLLARIGRGIGLPTIPFFIVAGIITGPNTPGFTLIEDPHSLELFAAIGLVLLLFNLGIEFSLTNLISGGRWLVLAGATNIVLNVGGGLAFGLLLGWGTREAFVIAGAVGISSSAIVTKLLVELRRLANEETPLILGINVVQDVFLAFYLALLQPILRGSENLGEGLALLAQAFSFLFVLVFVARYGAHWVARLIGSSDDELLTVLFIGLAILVAGLASELGVSDAIGAFMVGMIVAETPLRKRIGQLVLPLRDAFAAVFFFAFGLTIDPQEIGSVGTAVVLAVALSVVLNIASGVLAAQIYRFNRRSAANIGLTVLGRGEFSLILATLAAGAGLDSRIGPFVALYVLAMAVIGPVSASRSGLLAALLPVPLFRYTKPPRVAQAGEASPMEARLVAHRTQSQEPGLSQELYRLATERWSATRSRWRVGNQSGPERLLVPFAWFVLVLVFGVAAYMMAGFTLPEALSLAWADVTPADPVPELGDASPPWLSITVTGLGLLTLLGVLITAISVASEGGFGFSSRRRRMEEHIERLHDHYIVCAYGRVGQATARELESEGVPLVVIDVKQALEPQMRKDGVLYIVGDPTSETILRQAGIERAKGIVCAVDSDATNVYVTLTARSLNPDIYIVARASSPDSPARLQRAGANRVISPYHTSGRQMALLVMRPRVVDSLEVLGRRLEELAIEDGSPLIGRTVAQACGAAVPLLIHRADGPTITNPGPEEPVQAGDRILAWGAAADLRPMESAE